LVTCFYGVGGVGKTTLCRKGLELARTEFLEITTVAPEIVKAALDSVNHASGDSKDVALAAITANSDIARRGMQFSTDVTNELIREQDSALARAQSLFSAAATGGASQVAEQSGRIAYAAVAGAVLVAAVALYKR
jgi:hypothetical protein